MTRGLQVLEILAGMRQPATLGAIAARAGLSESQTFRVLRALESDGYVDHFGRSGYRIGSRSLALATLVGPRPQLLRAVYPVITRLATVSRQAAVLHLRSGAHRVLVLGVPSQSGPLREPHGILGERSPLAVGASGRAILAHLPADEVRGLAPDAATLERLETIRDRGYETSYEENHPGINGISAPLLAQDSSDQVVLGAISLAGDAADLPRERLEGMSRILLAACQELAPRLSRILGPQASATVDALDL
ncbi:IclR family transcriptional regulator [Nocardioides luteus]|uniref:IclR family transcriptional regulator n=1 Tax=Nocardioides luteus TaxID=1844 RepID=UPI001E56724E|nr:helix-turn-helix domain-containing protein [Nocardioides luteus]